MRTLCRQYSEEVHAQDFDGASTLRYRWADLPNGVRLTRFTRRVLRELYVEAEEAGEEMPPTLTDKGGISALMSWLLGNTEDGELRFPAPFCGRDQLSLRACCSRGESTPKRSPTGCGQRPHTSWTSIGGSRSRSGVDHATFVGAREGDDEMSGSAAGDTRPAVELIGLANSDAGAGEAARRLACAMSTAGIDHEVTSLDRQPTNRLGVAPPRERPRAHTTSVSSSMWIPIHSTLDRRLPSDSTGYRIGYWSWERRGPQQNLRHSFEFLNEVWCPTEFSCSAVRARSDVPVMKVPMPFVEPPVDRTLDRSDLGLPTGFLFMSVLDFLSGVERWNPSD